MGFLRNVGNFVTFGAIDKHEAKKITRNAKNREGNAREELEVQRDKTQKSLELLGNKKAEIYSNSISNFATLYEKIGKVSLKPMKENDNLFDSKEYKLALVEMKNVSTNLKDIATTAGAGALGSAIAVGGAWGLASLIGTASTGTAIGTLSGAAATNATLAWLGGGAISAGGAGMAGGMVVLGGVALAPIAVFAMFMGTQKGKQRLNAAKDYSDQVDVLVEKVKTLIAELYQVQRGVNLVGRTLIALDELFQIKLEEMESIVTRLDGRPILQKIIIDPIKKVFSIDLFSEEEKEIICETANCASLMRGIIDKPLLNEEGAFLSEAFSYMEDNKKLIDSMLIDEGLPHIKEFSFV